MIDNTNELTDEQIDAIHYADECTHIRYEFYALLDAMIEDILLLEEDLVRWRKALIPHLTPENAEGLQSDILDGLARNYEGMPAFDWFVREYCENKNPMENEEHCKRMGRLRKGIDESSVFLR
ncbi:MAG: potassium channel protein [Eubacteriales bacterium]|nr:potassium channel protein [Eubacteriales bacterium]